jgi:thiamine monophosphate synthase
MRWQEQTVAALQRYRAWLPPSLPLVAIGGIELSRVPEARRHGAQAVAAVRPFARPAAPREVLQAWRDAWSAP